MRFLLNSLTRIPLPLMYALGWILYFVAYRLMRWRRERAELDLRNALPDKDDDERGRILQRAYRNLADTLVEAFWGFGASAGEFDRRVSFENPELVSRCVEARRSVVLLTAHYGNWEWLSLAAGVRFGIS